MQRNQNLNKKIKKVVKNINKRANRRARRRANRMAVNSILRPRTLRPNFGSAINGWTAPEVKHGPLAKANSALELDNRMNQTKMNYYRALLDPEYACINNVPVKFPSPYFMPTKTVNLKNTFNFQPNNHGCMLLTWRPGMMATTDAYQKIGTWLYNKTLTNYSGCNRGKDVALCSQLTFNNNASLDGETYQANNTFIGSKIMDLPILKYRLVSAKLTVTYNGKVLDEAGSIISGQYVGGLRPISIYGSNYTDTTHTSNLDLTIEGGDMSDECSQFSKFDSILNLPYGQKEPVVKGRKYSYFYYPMDDLAKCFVDSANYGIGDDQPGWKNSASGTYLKGISYTTFQDGLSMMATDGTNWINATNEDVSSVPITVPSYIIALHNLTPGSACIEVNLYENYECIFNVDGAMISRTGPSFVPEPEEAKKVEATVFESVANSIRSNITPGRINQAIKIANAIYRPTIGQNLLGGRRPLLIPDRWSDIHDL